MFFFQLNKEQREKTNEKKNVFMSLKNHEKLDEFL